MNALAMSLLKRSCINSLHLEWPAMRTDYLSHGTNDLALNYKFTES